MAATLKTVEYRDDSDKIIIIRTYLVDGLPIVAKADGALPALGAADPDVAACKCVERKVVVVVPGLAPSSTATLTFSDEPAASRPIDGAATVRLDMLGRTQRQYWDIGTPANGIGINHEGVDAYRPYMDITYEHLSSSVPTSDILGLTGRVNDASYKGYAGGTLLFLGALAEQTGGAKWRIEYHFLYNPGGHQASWRNWSEDDATEGAKKIVRRRYGDANGGTIYLTGDFTDLPI